MEASLVSLAIVTFSAALMWLALPKANLAALAPIGAAGLFWAWFGSSPGRAFLIGFWGGAVYFSLAFSWFGQTAGAYVAPFGFLLVVAPALVEALAFALAGALSALAWRRMAPSLAPVGAAAAFAVLEWLRSIGPLGVPFGNLSYSQVQSPFAPLAAFVGSFGITFALCVLAAYAAAIVRVGARGDALRAGAVAGLAVLAGIGAAWAAWPARAPSHPAIRVAAIQGDIPQTIKWTRSAFDLALARYSALTKEASATHPSLILWPETALTTDLNLSPPLVAEMGSLARDARATLIVGAKQSTAAGEYNALYVFGPNGALASVYRKRVLVPFVETLPAPWLFGRLPVASLISRFRAGDSSGVVDAGAIRIGPLVCWESAFDDAAHRAVRDGAQALAVATDDAWFGTTAGPYQHAEIAQMRAIENGTWILRAAATGISGIISPAGRYVRIGPLGRTRIVAGAIGPPRPTLYSRVGALPVALAMMVFYGLLVIAAPLVRT